MPVDLTYRGGVLFRWLLIGSELSSGHMLQNQTPVVPDRVVFGILREELRCKLEGGVGVVLGFDLRIQLSVVKRFVRVDILTLSTTSLSSA